MTFGLLAVTIKMGTLMSEQKINANQNILAMEYAVRGPIPQRAAKLKDAGQEVIFCNIGNPQALGQPPVTYYRQVVSLLEEPAKIERERQLKNLFEETPFSDLHESDFIPEDVLSLISAPCPLAQSACTGEPQKRHCLAPLNDPFPHSGHRYRSSSARTHRSVPWARLYGTARRMTSWPTGIGNSSMNWQGKSRHS